MGITDGEHNGEQAAHYLEFVFEMISSVITFWFCMDNKLRVDTMRLDIMLAPEGAEVLIVDQSAKHHDEHDMANNFLNVVPRVTRMSMTRGTIPEPSVSYPSVPVSSVSVSVNK